MKESETVVVEEGTVGQVPQGQINGGHHPLTQGGLNLVITKCEETRDVHVLPVSFPALLPAAPVMRDVGRPGSDPVGSRPYRCPFHPARQEHQDRPEEEEEESDGGQHHRFSARSERRWMLPDATRRIGSSSQHHHEAAFNVGEASSFETASSSLRKEGTSTDPLHSRTERDRRERNPPGQRADCFLPAGGNRSRQRDETPIFTRWRCTAPARFVCSGTAGKGSVSLLPLLWDLLYTK